jgi:hypothetical protein
MYNSPEININDENVDQQISQEYSDNTYHEMQPVSFASISQSIADINSRKSSFRTLTVHKI